MNISDISLCQSAYITRLDEEAHHYTHECHPHVQPDIVEHHDDPS
jgi:hypothetical protein